MSYQGRSSGKPNFCLEWIDDDFVSRCQQLNLTASRAMSQHR
jgi:hypothetical protein